MSKKVLITGAAGFLGYHLIESLLKEDVEIVALDLVTPKHQYDNEQIKWHITDLLNDDISEYFNGIDIVYHLAGRFLPGNSDDILAELNKLNVEGTKRVAQAASKTGIKRIVHISSIAACEESGSTIVNEDSGKFTSSYGQSKMMSEVALKENVFSNTNYIIIRPVAFFGENHTGSIFELAKAIKSKRFIMIGKGNNCTNFLYVKDLVNVLIELGFNEDIINQVFIISDERLSLLELTNTIRTELRLQGCNFYIPRFFGMLLADGCDVLSRITRRPLPLSIRRFKAMTRDVWYSNRKLRDIIPDFKYGVRSGLKRTIEWYKSQNLL